VIDVRPEVPPEKRASGAVVVCADRSAAAHRALRWAAAEARRRNAPLHVVATGQPAPKAAGSLFADAVATVSASVSGLPILGGGRSAGPVAGTLRELSAEAAVVVVPTTLPELSRVVAECYCPVVAVPEQGPEAAAERGPVVLGAAPWTGEEVVELAFREADARRADLIAVRTWSDPLIDIGSLRPEQLRRWGRAEECARHELELELSPWTVIYPRVHAEAIVVQDRPTEFLLALSHRARLLVLGRSQRGALLGLIAGSPAGDLLRATRCPVLVVPATGPPRSTWLPAGTHGWTLSRS
jgi:nucleotide-binding universal stress UspA family protein